MIFAAVEADGPQIRDITARAGVFSQEEIECVSALWEDYVTTGPVAGGYNFLVEREEDRVLGFACYGPRDLTSGVFDLYWIAVDSNAHRSGAVSRQLHERSIARTSVSSSRTVRSRSVSAAMRARSSSSSARRRKSAGSEAAGASEATSERKASAMALSRLAIRPSTCSPYTS